MDNFWTKLCAFLLPGVVLALIVGGIIAMGISVARGADCAPNDTEIQMAFIEGFRWGSLSGMLAIGEGYLPEKTIREISKAKGMKRESSTIWLPVKVLPKYKRAVDLLREVKK